MEKTDDELISEFMGFTCDNDFGWYEGPRKEGVITAGFGNVFAFNVKDSQFHTSWDWLMPAYNKFSSLDLDAYEFPDYCASIAEKVLEFDVAGASEALVLGIKWYNQQK